MIWYILPVIFLFAAILGWLIYDNYRQARKDQKIFDQYLEQQRKIRFSQNSFVKEEEFVHSS